MNQGTIVSILLIFTGMLFLIIGARGRARRLVNSLK